MKMITINKRILERLRHIFPNWNLAQEGEQIPEGVLYLGKEPLTEAELARSKWAEERARQWQNERFLGLLEENERLKAENEQLREALAVYGNQKNWVMLSHPSVDQLRSQKVEIYLAFLPNGPLLNGWEHIGQS